ncbi:MAG: DUF484 domain-containing protein [Sedimenticola sp.]|jgi:hypothetical protein|nr:MAG: DUF484 domain-containing protein [Sedimenticola sp.]
MNSQADQAKVAGKQSGDDIEQTVVDYLKGNPDFFDRHRELLQQIEVSHASGEAVSLIERQVKTLREQSEHYKKKLDELVVIARENEQLNNRLHNLTLTLLDAVEFDEVVNALEDKLHDDFQAEAVELHLFSQSEAEGSNPDLDGFRDFIDACKPVCGRITEAQLSYLFGAQSDDVRSTAMIPIQADGILGILAIGSKDPHRFHPGMGTDYLARLGEIVSKTLEVVSEPGF